MTIGDTKSRHERMDSLGAEIVSARDILADSAYLTAQVTVQGVVSSDHELNRTNKTDNEHE